MVTQEQVDNQVLRLTNNLNLTENSDYDRGVKDGISIGFPKGVVYASLSRQAKRDLFGSHTTAAVEVVREMYKSKYDPENCQLISTQSLILALQEAFLRGVIWKEDQND